MDLPLRLQTQAAATAAGFTMDKPVEELRVMKRYLATAELQEAFAADLQSALAEFLSSLAPSERSAFVREVVSRIYTSIELRLNASAE